MDDERLWDYGRLTRLWGGSMIVASAIVLGLAVALRSGSEEGLTRGWLAVFAGVGLGTLVIGLPVVRLGVAAPSSRMVHAVAASGPRRLEASPGEWRRWALVTGAVLVVGAMAMMIFLIAVLGEGGTAEGVVVGLLGAWGLATLADAHQIRHTERSEGRHYYAAVRRPTAVGRHLVYEAEPA